MQLSQSILSLIHALKHQESELKLTICDSNGNAVGQLVPITIGHLSDESLIAQFVTWRNRDRCAWLDQREVTLEGTRLWLKKLLADDRRMAFLIYNHQRLLIGRLGFLDLTDQSAMIDSIIRGLPAISPGIMTRSFFTMTDWLFQNTAIDRLYSKVLPDNSASMKLHHALGFHLEKTIPLATSKTSHPSQVWTPVDETINPDPSNLKSLNIMCLLRPVFQPLYVTSANLWN